MTPNDGSILSARAALSRVAAFTLLGFVAGFLLFLIEAVDLLEVLWPSINGFSEVVRLTILFGVTVFGTGIVATLLGLAGTALEAVRQAFGLAIGRIRSGIPPIALDTISLFVGAAFVTVVLKVISRSYPQGLESSIERLVNRIDERLMPIPFVIAHWRGLYLTAIFLVALGVMWSHLWIFRPKGKRSNLLAGIVFSCAAVALVICYNFDARAFFARYEWTIHYPLVTGYTVMTILAAGFGARMLTSMQWARDWTRQATLLTVVLGSFGLGCTAYAFVAMDANQNVKSLLWNRSVIARRCYEIARWSVDRDRDGYSPILGGGDADDSNPSIHPFAPEIAGNGIDDNGLSGDLSIEDAQTRPRAPESGEFVSVADVANPPFEPKSNPANTVDVVSADATATTPLVDQAGRPNVVIISIDCLRADHTTMGGYGRDLTPNIARYANDGLTFTNAIPHGTNTGHSFSAMMRSSYMDGIFNRAVPTLTQLLKRVGYHAAFVNARRLNDWLTPKRWHKYRPTMIGDFDVLHLEGEREWTADQLTDVTISYVDRLPKNRPEFLWVHYMDVHMPREGHPEYGFGDRDIDVYDAEIKYTDAAVGRLLDHMRESGLLENSIVFITADHGEGFLEHGTRDHSNKPYADNSHVPLVVFGKGIQPASIATPVGLFDIAPTALVHVGLPVPDVYRGIDLVASTKLAEFPKRVIVSETPRNGIETSFFAWAYIDWPYKYVYDIRGMTSELYNLESDPNEQHNLVEIDPTKVAAMRAALGRWLDLETVQVQPTRASK